MKEILHALHPRKMAAIEERRTLQRQGKVVKLRRVGEKWGVFIVKG